MTLFDPGAVNKQIDAYIASVPPGKRVVLLGNVNLVSKQAGAAIMLKVSDTLSGYIRVTKIPGQHIESDAGFKIAFLAGMPDEEVFTFSELVKLLEDRGLGWVRARMGAYRLMRGGHVELDELEAPCG